MAKMEVLLQVWQSSGANVQSIQGEAGARNLDVTFLDASGEPISLIGCTPRMYVGNRMSPPPFNDGTIIDAAGGKAEFVITSDMLARPGDWSCEFLLVGSNYPPLKANGLILHVDASSAETEISNTNEWHTVSRMIVKVEESSAIAQQAATDAQKAVTDANGVISDINAKETEIAAAESTRKNNETARQTAESSRVTAESGRVTEFGTLKADSQTATQAANAAASNANHVPQYGENGNWQSWDGTEYKDTSKPWKGEKGNPFEYGSSFDTLAALQAAYPTGDTKGHLVGEMAYIWDSSAWKPTGADLSGYVKNTTTVNGKALSANIVLGAADVGAAAKSTPVTATVVASAWTGSAAPYSQALTVAGAKPEPTRIEVQPSSDATADQWAAWRAALIRGGGQDTDKITLLADGDKPTIDIPVAVTIRGDVS